MASAASLGAALTYPFLLFHGNEINKRSEILLAATFFFLGSFLICVSGVLDWEDYTGLCFLIVGRFIYGTGIATSLHSVPQYIAEVVPPDIRGQLGASTEAMVMTGMCLGFAVGYTFDLISTGWVATFAFACVLAILMGLGTFFLPNSPTWMVYNDFDHIEIKEALQFVFPYATEVTVQNLVRQIGEDHKLRLDRQRERKANMVTRIEQSWVYRVGLYDSMTPELQLIMQDQTLYRGLVIKVVINFFKIFTGQTAILYYASSIFGEVDPKNVEELIMGYIALRTLVAYFMLFAADSLGRRYYMLASAANMGIALYITTVSFAFSWNTAAVVSLYAAGVGFEYGFGSVTYFLLNEVVPYYIRSTANAVANCFLFTCYFLMTFIFPTMEMYWGFMYIFMFFCTFNLFAFYFIFYYLPETRDVNLERAYLLVDPMFDSAPTLSSCCWGDDDEFLKKEKSATLFQSGRAAIVTSDARPWTYSISSFDDGDENTSLTRDMRSDFDGSRGGGGEGDVNIDDLYEVKSEISDMSVDTYFGKGTLTPARGPAVTSPAGRHQP